MCSSPKLRGESPFDFEAKYLKNGENNIVAAIMKIIGMKIIRLLCEIILQEYMTGVCRSDVLGVVMLRSLISHFAL